MFQASSSSLHFATGLSIATSQYPMPVRDVAARPHADAASVGVVLSLFRYRQDSYLCMCKLNCICARDRWLPNGRAKCTIYRSCRVSCQLVRLGTALRNAKQVLSRLRKIGRVTFARRSWWVGGGITPNMLCYSEMRRLLPGWIEKALAMHAYFRWSGYQRDTYR